MFHNSCVMKLFLFPAFGSCSFHDNAFVASRALHIVNALNANATFNLLEGIFKHQVRFKVY